MVWAFQGREAAEAQKLGMAQSSLLSTKVTSQNTMSLSVTVFFCFYLLSRKLFSKMCCFSTNMNTGLIFAKQ